MSKRQILSLKPVNGSWLIRGVNETLLEGYFIIQGFDEEKEDELSTVWDHLWEDDDEDRWESLIRAYLTTTKHGLPTSYIGTLLRL